MNKLTEFEKAYIAGFFDGEGCISISKYQGKNNRTPVYFLQVVIVQKGIDTLLELQQSTGIGSLHDRAKYSAGTYEWRIPGRAAADFLAVILPYLRNKKEEAEIAIEYQSKQGHKGSTGRGYTVPQELIDEKESYYLRLQNLKGKSGKGGKRGRPTRL
jgi:hypothetical protein